ncbi:MAG: Crp/Fnr family transcriptional regulator [Aureispira sp.]
MLHPLLEYFQQFQWLSSAERTAILESLEERFAEKGRILLHPDSTQSPTYFVIKGCIRQYYLIEGEERTTTFYTENQWLVAPSFPVEYYWEPTEDSQLVVGSESKAQVLYEQFPDFQKIAQQVLEQALEQQQNWMAGFVIGSAEMRYKKIIATRPDLLQRVPQHQLASYIGVKPETLSRIRKRLTPKKKP